MELVSVIKKRFNLLFAFSIGLYLIGFTMWITNLLGINNPLNDLSLQWIQFLFTGGVLISCLLISMIISFRKNYDLTIKLGLKRIWNSTFLLSCTELTIMVSGTLASLLFFMVMTFSDNLFFQTMIGIASGLLIWSNYKRPEILETISEKLSLLDKNLK